MKFSAVLFWLLFITITVSGQNYYAAIGSRVGFGFGLSGKWSPGHTKNFMEGIINYDLIKGRYGGYNGGAVTFLYERHFDMPRSFSGFNWYIGGGAGVGFGRQFVNFGFDPIIGLEYDVQKRKFPFCFSFDYKPRIYVVEKGADQDRVEPRDAAFSIRYFFD